MIRIGTIFTLTVAVIAAAFLVFRIGRVNPEDQQSLTVSYYVVGKTDLGSAIMSMEDAQEAEANWTKPRKKDEIRSGSAVVVFIDNPHKAPIQGNLEVWLPFSDTWLPVQVPSLGMAKRSLYVVNCGDLVTWSAPLVATRKRFRWKKIDWLH